MSFSFDHPSLLLGLPPLLLALWWIGRRSVSWPSFALRALGVSALLAALAGPSLLEPEGDPWRVVVLDASESAGGRQTALDLLGELPEPTGERRRLVLAGPIPEVASPALAAGEVRGFEAAPEGPAASGSDLAAALDAATACVPTGSGAAVWMVTDGRETAGDLDEAVARLRAAGHQLHIKVAGASPSFPIIEGVRAPSAARPGSTLPVTLTLGSSAALNVAGLEAVVRLASGRELRAPVRSSAEEAQAGRGSVTLELEMPVGDLLGEISLERRGVRLASPPWQLAIAGLEALRVDLVQMADATDLSPALGARLGSSAQIRRLTPEQLAEADLSQSAALFLCDIPAAALPEATVAKLESAVRSGLALNLTGGSRSFGPGGWAGQPIDRLSPLRSIQKEERRDPSATLVVIIDTSGSMGGGRIELAKEVARLAIERLKPHDKAGIVEFHGAKRWAAPIQPASNKVDLQRALNRLNAGGGTVILPAIEESYYGLLNARTRTRHVLVLTDGGVETGPFERVIRRMSKEGMTLSTVLVGGSGAYSSFLVSLAQWGRGRFYHAPDRFNLPEIIVKQPESSLLAPWVEGSSPLSGDGLAGLGRDAPQLEGRSLDGRLDTEAKTDVRILLRDPVGRPLLASWSYGLGSVQALATEISGPWTGALGQDPEWSRFLTADLRRRANLSLVEALDIQASVHSDCVDVVVRGSAPEGQALDVALFKADGEVARRPLLLSDPDLGEAPLRMRIPGIPEGAFEVRVLASGSAGGEAPVARALVTRSTATEWSSARPDTERLKSLAKSTGGSLSESLPSLEEATAPVRKDLANWFWLAAGVAFLAQLLTRRLAGAAALVLFCALPGLAPAAAAQPTQPSASISVLAEEPPPLGPDLLIALEEALEKPSASEQRAALEDLSQLVLARDGTPLAVERKLERLLVDRPQEAALHRALAFTTAESGDLVVALGHLRNIPEAAFEAEDAIEEALALELLGRDREADQALGAILSGDLELDPARRFALEIRHYGVLATLIGGEDRAQELMASLLERYSESPETARWLARLSAISGNPSHLLALPRPTENTREAFQALLFRGRFELAGEDYAAARESFREALSRAPLARDRRFAQERLIAAYRGEQLLPSLVAEWSAQADLAPERFEALVAVLRELGRAEEALDLLLSRRGPGSTPSRRVQEEIISLGFEAKRGDEVEAAWQALIDRQPRKLAWREGLALVKLLGGDREGGAAVMRQALEADPSPDFALRVAGLASTLALNDVAAAALDRASAEPGESRSEAELLRAELDIAGGDPEVALARLQALERTEGLQPKILARIAEVYERLKNPALAIAALEKLIAQDPAEDMIMRLAWLLEKTNKLEAALERWRDLRDRTKTRARRAQAEDRILDLASKNAKLADIAIALEERLEAGQGSESDLGFLVKIYARAADPVAATSLLSEYGPSFGGDRIQLLRNVARVLQACNDYPRYEKTLRELIAEDPEEALDYRRQIALSALERGKGRAARKALDEMMAAHPESSGMMEFAAGVLSMVELPELAERAYGLVLTRHPERIETHLLRAEAMKTAGRGDQALRIFLRLLERADRDDLFTVAVDGVLNLEGGNSAYEVALRRVRERVAARPGKAFLYQLMADLHEEIGNREGQILATELMVIPSGERRPAVLRELIDLSRSTGSIEAQIAFGQSLVALGEVMPPEVFIDLGQALVSQGDLTAAGRVFDRARTSGGDFLSIRKRIAEIWVANGFVERAERALRQALLARPNDIETLLSAGEYAATAGSIERARRDFLRAYSLLVEQTPRTVSAGGEGPRRERIVLPGGQVYFITRGGRNYDRNSDPFDQMAPKALNGLSAYADRSQIEGLLTQTRSEFEGIPADGGAYGEKLSVHLRLKRLVAALKQLGASVGLEGEVRQLRLDILAAFPKDKEERRALLAPLVSAERFEEAEGLAKTLDFDLEQEFPDVRRYRLLALPPAELVAKLDLGGLEPSEVSRLGSGLLLKGRLSELQALLDRFEPGPSSQQIDEAATLRGLERRIGRTERAEAWRAASYEHLVTKAPVPNFRQRIASVIEGRLRSFSDAEGDKAREAFFQQLSTWREAFDEPREKAFVAALEPVADRRDLTPLGLKPADEAQWVKRLQEAPEQMWSQKRILDQAPKELYSKLLVIAFERVKSHNRWTLLEIVQEKGPSLSEEASEALVTAFGKGRKIGSGSSFDSFSFDRLVSMPEGSTTRDRLLEQIREEAGKNPMLTLMVELQSLEAPAEELAAEAREELSTAYGEYLRATDRNWRLDNQLREWLAADGELAQAFRDTLEEVADEGAGPAQAVAAWLDLLRQRGASAERMLELSELAYEEQPNEASLFRNYASEVQRSRGWAAALRARQERIAERPAAARGLQRTVARQLMRAGRFEEALELMEKQAQGRDDLTVAALALKLGNEGLARTALARRFFGSGRRGGNARDANWPLAGDKVELPEGTPKLEGDLARLPQRSFARLSAYPFARDLMRRVAMGRRNSSTRDLARALAWREVIEDGPEGIVARLTEAYSTRTADQLDAAAYEVLEAFEPSLLPDSIAQLRFAAEYADAVARGLDATSLLNQAEVGLRGGERERVRTMLLEAWRSSLVGGGGRSSRSREESSSSMFFSGSVSMVRMVEVSSSGGGGRPGSSALPKRLLDLLVRTVSEEDRDQERELRLKEWEAARGTAKTLGDAQTRETQWRDLLANAQDDEARERLGRAAERAHCDWLLALARLPARRSRWNATAERAKTALSEGDLERFDALRADLFQLQADWVQPEPSRFAMRPGQGSAPTMPLVSLLPQLKGLAEERVTELVQAMFDRIPALPEDQVRAAERSLLLAIAPVESQRETARELMARWEAVEPLKPASRASLLRTLGDEAEALAIEVELLAGGKMAANRYVSVLTAFAEQDAAAAGALARELASDVGFPEVLALALGAARKEGASEEAAALAERLAAVAPEHEALRPN